MSTADVPTMSDGNVNFAQILDDSDQLFWPMLGIPGDTDYSLFPDLNPDMNTQWPDVQ